MYNHRHDAISALLYPRSQEAAMALFSRSRAPPRAAFSLGGDVVNLRHLRGEQSTPSTSYYLSQQQAIGGVGDHGVVVASFMRFLVCRGGVLNSLMLHHLLFWTRKIKLRRPFASTSTLFRLRLIEDDLALLISLVQRGATSLHYLRVPQSALATARIISDIDAGGISLPRPELNDNAKSANSYAIPHAEHCSLATKSEQCNIKYQDPSNRVLYVPHESLGPNGQFGFRESGLYSNATTRDTNIRSQASAQN